MVSLVLRKLFFSVHTISPFFFRSRHFPSMKLRDCSKIIAFIIAFNRNINSRIYPTEKCREKDGVIRHLDALIWTTLSKRFAFALYRPCVKVISIDVFYQPAKFGTTFLEHPV